ncbi:MAG: hypothetical protein HND47_06825 [Chloroflexi bacterium]|nr:hypothetical protein [Chloroflexota bacterium]
MTLLLSFLGLAPRVLLGYWIVRQVWRTPESKNILIEIFAAGAVGFGASSLFSFLWIWSGLPLRGYAAMETILAIGVTGLMLIRDRKDISSVGQYLLLLRNAGGIWLLLLAIGTAFFAIGLILVNLEYPHGRMDAWTNWNVVSRFIYLGGEDWKNTFLRQLDHPDYPLFMAMNNAVTWSILQKSAVWGPIAFHALLAFFTAGLLFAFVDSFKGVQQASLAAVLFMTQPFAFGSSMTQYADFPLACIILGAGGFTLVYVETSEKGAAVLAGFLAGLAAWTKNEGAAFALIASILWLILSLRINRAAFRNYLYGLAFPLAVVILFKLFLAPSNDILSGAADVSKQILDARRYVDILGTGARTLWNLGEGPISLTGLIIAYALIVGGSRDKLFGGWVIGIIILLQLSAYFAIYLITPHDLDWHLETSINRLYLHVFPLALLWLFIWLKSPRELSKER